MKIKQFTNLPNLTKSSLSTSSLTQLFAAGSLAIGVVVMIPVAPASAVSITTGQLAFADGTLDFYDQVDPVANDSFKVDFTPNSIGLGSGTGTGTGSFGSFFPSYTTYGLAPSTGNFSYISGNSTANVYQLTNSLNFDFSNGVTIAIGAGTTFTGGLNSTLGQQFSLANSVGSSIRNGADVVALPPTFTFQFSDGITTGGGNYNFTVSPLNSAAAVPEPFTIIGTVVGGIAAFRMRKKLASSTKN
jgi:hypothetical protein